MRFFFVEYIYSYVHYLKKKRKADTAVEQTSTDPFIWISSLRFIGSAEMISLFHQSLQNYQTYFTNL